MKIRLERFEDGRGLYRLPFEPDNPLRPAEVAVIAKGRVYHLEAWPLLEEGLWLLPLPLHEEEVELVYFK